MACKITFLGAAGTVTGSSYLVETPKTKFIVDCGFYQGDKKLEKFNYDPFRYDPRSLDFVILTHAHLDHCGLLPKLYREGFHGKIFCTPPTRDLAKLILTDAAQIQENGVRERDLEILFSLEDTTQTVQLLTPKTYGQPFSPASDVKIVFRDAGHILGSALVEVFADDKKIVFSGDLGNSPVPIMKNPEAIYEADYVVCESTYGNRNHVALTSRNKELLSAVRLARQRHSRLIIPSFALERSQDLLYTFNELKNTGQLGNIPIVLDSPLATKITRVYKTYTKYFDSEFLRQLAQDPDLFSFPGFKETPTREQSIELNTATGEMIIIAGSGMADAGRVQHHLQHHLGDPNAQVLFVGYQAGGTLGRKLVDGATRVRVRDHMLPVRAHIKKLESFSAHADQKGILNWLSYFTTHPKIILTHGEDESRRVLSEKITAKLKAETLLPKLGQTYEL
jgi:metallo-beta-lactamase family protein